jgi:hypothetical protein
MLHSWPNFLKSIHFCPENHTSYSSCHNCGLDTKHTQQRCQDLAHNMPSRIC